MFVVLAIAAASVMSPGAEGSDVSQSQALAACVTSSVETTEQVDVRDSMVPGVPADAIRQQAVAAAADDYVLCAARAGLVDTATVLSSNTGVASIADGSEIEFTLPAATAAWFVAQLVEAGVVVSAADRLELGDSETTGSATAPTNRLVVVLGLIAVAAFATWFIWAYLRRRRGLVPAVADRDGSSGKRVKKRDIPETRFTDVAGAAEAVEDLREMVEVLRHPERYRSVGARPPKGALLVGPPGTGKTLLARAVAGEAGVPFFAAAGSDFVEKYVGVGSKRVRELFEQAKRAEAAIVFIDEIDAIGRRRASGDASPGEVEGENTLISLLHELDGFRSSNVVVLAATNRADVLDPALLRPGRLDRKVHVGLPDARERRAILDVHTRNKPLATDVDLAAVAQRTPGMSGAQLEQICNEAALLAARAQQPVIGDRHFSEATEYVAIGRARRSATVHPTDRLVTAWHEAGHVVAAMRAEGATRPVSVSIVPRGAVGGATWMQESDIAIVSRRQLESRLVVALGGRAAEERLLGGECTAGAAGDLAQATATARQMVESLGMTEAGLSTDRSDRAGTEAAAEALLQTAHRRAHEVLETNHQLLEAVASSLLEKDELSSAELADLDRSYPAPVPAGV